MEFESPDVQKDFPGLYASESGKRSNESDYSDDGHEKVSKKDLLIGKRKDKKDSKKDRGYAALEGESSPEEDPEIKSPSKNKKTKSFKFPSKKEKREKSRDKDVKEKDKDIEKKKEKETKIKLKLKDRKKSKHGEESFDIAEELPIFGVPLDLAVQRNRCHDGVDIPLVVRDCIDYVEEQCMNMENIYKLSGIKSKVHTLKRLYNHRDSVCLNDYEPPVITSLIKLFLRELPEPVLTNELSARFEEAAATKDTRTRQTELNSLISQLPRFNKQLLAWLMIHFDNVTTFEKLNRMNAQNVAIELSPVLQMSHRLFTALLCHCRSLFPNMTIKKYIPPLTAGVGMPETEACIQQELAKQESLLNQIHMEMNAGHVSKTKEEQLWEVQRIVTQLKRKLRTVQRAREMTQKSLEEEKSQIHSSVEDEFQLDLTLQKARSEEDPSSVVVAPNPVDQQPVPVPVIETPIIGTKGSPSSPEFPQNNNSDSVEIPLSVSTNTNIEVSPSQHEGSPISDEEILPSTSIETNQEDFPSNISNIRETVRTSIVIDTPEEWQGLLQEETALQLEHRELLSLQAGLQGRVQEERNEIERLRAELATARAKCNYRSLEEDSSEGSSSSHSDVSESEDDPVRKASILELKRENQMLQEKKSDLVRRIMEEREACLHLRVQLSLLQLSQESKQL